MHSRKSFAFNDNNEAAPRSMRSPGGRQVWSDVIGSIPFRLSGGLGGERVGGQHRHEQEPARDQRQKENRREHHSLHLLGRFMEYQFGGAGGFAGVAQPLVKYRVVMAEMKASKSPRSFCMMSKTSAASIWS